MKGYSHQKAFDKCWDVYQEMIQANMRSQFSSVTYNTLIDACARCGEIGRAPTILEDMLRQGVEPNLVSYSAVLKGYCQENKLDKAFELLETMKGSKHVQPDELVYNTLLDGCARQALYKRGMQVFAEMEERGVKPSNFTLSVLVKLANRGHHLEEAFALCATISEKYRFRLNVHVYNNLIQACIAHKDRPRGLEVAHEMMLKEVRPDARTYTMLLRGFNFSEDGAAVEGLLRAALGLPEAHPMLADLEPETVRLESPLSADIISEVLQSLAPRSRCCNERMVRLLSELRHVPGLELDSKLVMRLTANAMHSPGKGMPLEKRDEHEEPLSSVQHWCRPPYSFTGKVPAFPVQTSCRRSCFVP
jgi:pentatricopeptide repeat protein